MQGVIIEIGSNLYKAINKENGEKYNLIPRGKLKKEETTPVVGDNVEFNEQGTIEKNRVVGKQNRVSKWRNNNTV